MWCCKFIFKDIICLMRSWFPLFKGEQGSYRYIKPKTAIRLCSIQLRLILVLHYTIVSFWCHPICRPNKVTERKMMNLFHPIVSYYRIFTQQSKRKNKPNHPISSNSHPLATANKAIQNLKIGGLQNQREHLIILAKYESVHPTVVSENYSSPGMLII